MVDFRFADDVEEFRAGVRAFLASALSPSAVAGQDDPADLSGLGEAFERRLHREAGARGWLSLPPERQAVFNYEAGRADAPLVDTAMTLAGPVVAAYGSGWQRDLLAQMAAGRVTMCIAYTEAGAGSDLSAIEATASAEPSGDGWVLRGTKVLVTGAHKADWCCTVARTRLDVPAKRGMSMFLVDMRAPGVDVVRRPTMNGWTLGDVVFHDVALRPSALLGTLDGGWRQLVSSVAAERSGMFWLGFARHVFELLVDVVRSGSRDGVPLAQDLIARDTVARLAVDLAAAERLSRRTLWTLLAADGESPGTDETPRLTAHRQSPGTHETKPTTHRQSPGTHETPRPTAHRQASGALGVPEVPGVALTAMAKVVATELLQDIAQAATELAGEAGLAWAPPFAPADAVPPGAAAGGRLAWEYLERVHGTISVGANELQRDTVAQVGLGLPRRER
jgi:alkylation response protein AidB-like acyl-CoA dehydrogenase